MYAKTKMQRVVGKWGTLRVLARSHYWNDGIEAIPLYTFGGRRGHIAYA